MAARPKKKPPQAVPETPDGPEIVFGLVAPVGVDLDEITAMMTEALANVSYRVQAIKLSQLLHDFPAYRQLKEKRFEDERIHEHMNAGNDLREKTKRNDALALLAIGAVSYHRFEETGGYYQPCSRKAFVLRSLKHPDEVDVLRGVYGSRFHLISASSTRDVIVKSLARRIADSHNSLQSTEYQDKAEALVTRDESEDSRHGQQLRNTFHKADLFVNVNDKEQLKGSINRYVEAVFGYQFHTPRPDEYAMFLAHAAALRSASLGRQVGAAVATKTGDIVAVGTNEVPKSGGGLYWEGDEPDRRDHVIGYDSSDEMKHRILGDLLNRLKECGWLSSEKKQFEVDALVKAALDDPKIRSTQMMHGIEFMRAVHAEMAALVNAATRGVSVKACTLYTTTFPCHDCAKHIVAAGIERVAYIEPYPKSLAVELYPDSVSVDSREPKRNQVPFEPFSGIAPRKYVDLFTMIERKRPDGKVKPWDRSTAIPRALHNPVSFYTSREASSIELFSDAMIKAGLSK